MEILSNSASLIISNDSLSSKPHKTQIPITNLKLSNSKPKRNSFNLNLSSFTCCLAFSSTLPTTALSDSVLSSEKRHWMVLMETPKQDLSSKEELVDFYVKTLQRVLPSKEEAQMCIYDVCLETHFGFCCDIDEEASLQLSRLPGVLSVRPDPDFDSAEKNYDPANVQPGYQSSRDFEPRFLFPLGTTKHWLVRMDKPGIGVVTKAQMVDYYAQILAKVMGNERDAQMCIYHVSWQSNFGFCCELDEDCAKDLAGVPGVLSVVPDKNVDFDNKDYRGNLQSSKDQSYSSEANETAPIKTRKLFVTGLSFYTSEKTLRAAFEGFGELVEVRIIMDKISKRSKGYAFIEYTTEEAASAALKEMNGKIINGWMIVVDVAKPSKRPPSSGRGRGPVRQT